MRKSELEKQIEIVIEIAVSHRMIKRGFREKVTSECRPKRGRRVSQCGIRAKNIPGRRKSTISVSWELCKKAIIAAEWTKGRVLGEFREEGLDHILVLWFLFRIKWEVIGGLEAEEWHDLTSHRIILFALSTILRIQGQKKKGWPWGFHSCPGQKYQWPEPYCSHRTCKKWLDLIIPPTGLKAKVLIPDPWCQEKSEVEDDTKDFGLTSQRMLPLTENGETAQRRDTQTCKGEMPISISKWKCR